MQLQYVKRVVALLWVLAAVVIGAAVDLTLPARLALAAVGFLPPLAILLLWNEPPQTMSESIRDARR